MCLVIVSWVWDYDVRLGNTLWSEVCCLYGNSFHKCSFLMIVCLEVVPWVQLRAVENGNVKPFGHSIFVGIKQIG